MNYNFLISFVVAALIAFSATPIARKVAFKFGAIDVPMDSRRLHKKPKARLGGLAIISGFIVVTIYNLVNSSDLFFVDKNIGFYIAVASSVLLIILLGVLDDIKHLRATYKLIVQLVACFIVVFIAEIRITSVTNPFVENGFYELDLWASYILTIGWIIGVTNAFNLLDGLDGLAAGVACISSMSLFFIALGNNDLVSAIITISLAGASLGFLPYNFNPAKIFMGDTGSLFLGFVLSLVTIQGTIKSYAAMSLIVPLIVLGLPVFDTLIAIGRRVLTKKSIMQADRGHIHHKLVDMGLTHKQSVIVLYCASATLGLSGIVSAQDGIISATILVIAVTLFIVVGAKYMAEISYDYEYDDYEKKVVDTFQKEKKEAKVLNL